MFSDGSQWDHFFFQMSRDLLLIGSSVVQNGSVLDVHFPGSIPSPVSVGDLHQKHRLSWNLDLYTTHSKSRSRISRQTGFLIVNDGKKQHTFFLKSKGPKVWEILEEFFKFD